MDFVPSDVDNCDVNKDQGNLRKDEPAGLACQACRRKKAKCSRESPCSQCSKNGIPCFYDREKNKPGMKAGAIERLNQRMDTLENMFLGQGLLWKKMLDNIQEQQHHNSQLMPSPEGNLSECTEQLKRTLESLGRQRVSNHDNEEEIMTIGAPFHETRKRRRISNEAHEVSDHGNTSRLDAGTLPSDLIDSLAEIYFSRVHPWIPILHVRQFRQQMQTADQRSKIKTILQAISSICIRFSDDVRLGSSETRMRLARESRQTVILDSMESFSVENLQASIICAFDIIGSGRGPSAWSIVGSMARTVEQLQLSIEDDTDQVHLHQKEMQVLVKRMKFLRPCVSWSEKEERRRVFWNVFLMDRFCSITTGWNVCLTSADVKRRLPCEGALWEEGNPLSSSTPYFGVSGPPDHASNRLPSTRSETDDQASLGGFAYCIEATENLSLVTSFFLQQAVDVAKTHDVQIWLMRFKQLDLRLVQWKIFLPERWQQACALNGDGNMDPNLTLAHITHNTSVVLLHQGIAYPSLEWQSVPINLPAASSADTCLAAAIEVSIIAKEFLRNTKILTSPQFAFCLFVCGRMLIAHSTYYNIPLPKEFDGLVTSLQEMSKRWNGVDSLRTENLASKFAVRLDFARRSGVQASDMREAAYSDDQYSTPNGDLTGTLNEVRNLQYQNQALHPPTGSFDEVVSVTVPQGESPDSITLAFPPLPVAFQAQQHSLDRESSKYPSSSYIVSHGRHRATKKPSPDNTSLVNDISFEDMATYLDCSFLPDERISAFSNQND